MAAILAAWLLYCFVIPRLRTVSLSLQPLQIGLRGLERRLLRRGELDLRDRFGLAPLLLQHLAEPPMRARGPVRIRLRLLRQILAQIPLGARIISAGERELESGLKKGRQAIGIVLL